MALNDMIRDDFENNKDVLILGIESSCDETAASVVLNGRTVLSNVISTQIEIHKQYGGVVPEIASRAHLTNIIPVIDKALKDANVALDDISAVAVTYGPGLVGALLVGLSAAKGIAMGAGKPLIGVNHIAGHIAGNYISHPELEPPFTCLIVSGGHSHIVNVSDHDKFELIGRTRDDAVGEAFDKVARTIGLGYPGGPLIQKASLNGNEEAFDFPRVRFKDGTLDFSFSGLKTAVINQVNMMKMKNEDIPVADIAASFQKAAVDILVENTIKAAALSQSNKIVVAGGVSANSKLRESISDSAAQNGSAVYYPELIYCTDNAAMIASAGYYEYTAQKFSDLSLNAFPGLKIS